MANQPDFVVEILLVKKGDFGTRFLELNGTLETDNRPIDTAHRDKIAANWTQHRVGMCYLIRKNAEQFYVFDGQHRLSAASIVGDVLVPCRIDSMPPDNGRDFLTELNTGQKRHLPKDVLVTYQRKSIWETVFAALGAPALPISGRRGVMGWVDVMNSIISKSGGSLKARQLEAWLTTDRDLIANVAEFTSWWLPVTVQAHDMKIGGMTAPRVLRAAYAIFNENKGNPDMALVQGRMFQCKETRTIGLYRSSGWADLAPLLRRAMNYRSSKTAIKVDGLTGKEK